MLGALPGKHNAKHNVIGMRLKRRHLFCIERQDPALRDCRSVGVGRFRTQRGM